MRDQLSEALRRDHWAVPLSLAVHVLVGIVLICVPHRERARPQRLNSVAVDIVARRPALPLPASPRQMKADPADAAPPNAPSSRPNGMVRATTLLSKAALAAPGSKQARETLPALAGDERILQLCNLEAIEQVQNWNTSFRPEVVVAYALRDVRIAERAVHATGAAFRSKRKWYRLEFNCNLSPDLIDVVSFEFRVGEVIPETDLEVYGLPASDQSLD